MVLILSEINYTLLRENLKSGQTYTENEPLGTPGGLISRTRLKKMVVQPETLANYLMTTLCTNFKQNWPTFNSKSVPVSQAEALKSVRNVFLPRNAGKIWKIQQLPVILELCLRNVVPGKSRGYRDVIVFEKLCFQNVSHQP